MFSRSKGRTTTNLKTKTARATRDSNCMEVQRPRSQGGVHPTEVKKVSPSLWVGHPGREKGPGSARQAAPAAAVLPARPRLRKTLGLRPDADQESSGNAEASRTAAAVRGMYWGWF